MLKEYVLLALVASLLVAFLIIFKALEIISLGYFWITLPLWAPAIFFSLCHLFIWILTSMDKD